MKPGAHIAARAAVRFYTPLIILLALAILFSRAPGVGVGFMAGLTLALALTAHALVSGANAARRAFPPAIARTLLALGVIATAAGAGVPRLIIAPQLLEGGLFLVTAAASALVLAVLLGRAPTLREDEA
jgi:hypothetical protein